jgi:succinoglycan biosynthesis protein ExoA
MIKANLSGRPEYPVVSVVMPVRNESAFIAQSLSSLLAQDYPMSRFEALVVDGMSQDGTRQIVEDVVRGQAGPSSSVPGRPSPVIRVLDNPGKIVPTALNIAIRVARGQWLIRLDAHSVYRPDYIRLCIETAQRTGSSNVGGVFVTLPRDDSPQALLVQAITTSRFGVGNAEYRLDVGEGPADTVPYGCFRREVFAEIGPFDERLVRNQDYEFNRRLTRAGKRIWLNPAIKVQYYNQATLAGLFRQAFGTGRWNPWTWFVAPYAFAPRHAVPGLFVLGLLVVLGSSFLVHRLWILPAAILAPYFVLALLASIQQGRRYGFGLALPLPVLFFTYHISYGLGTIWGALRLLFGATPVQRIREPWPGAGRFRAWPRRG